MDKVFKDEYVATLVSDLISEKIGGVQYLAELTASQAVDIKQRDVVAVLDEFKVAQASLKKIRDGLQGIRDRELFGPAWHPENEHHLGHPASACESFKFNCDKYK